MTLSVEKRWREYRQAAEPLPECNLVWPFWGNGLDSLGINGHPIETPMPVCGTDDILVRVDALGLCASDAKMVRMGRDYPLFFESDFESNPALLGHEAAFTVIAVGENWRAQFYPGQRLGIQPDVYVNGKREIFGVNLPGAMARYVVLDRNVLASDTGSCVFPVIGDFSYADIAVLEPWACVDVAYNNHARRLTPKKDGVLLIKGRPDDTTPYELNYPLESNRVVLSDVPLEMANRMRTQTTGVIERDGASVEEIAAEFTARGGLDDIILLDPIHAQTVAFAIDCLTPRGTLNLVTSKGLKSAVAVDLNKLHYKHLALLGCRGPDAAEAYGSKRNRSELKAGGIIWILGAGGTMGRAHLQRALQMSGGPRGVIATNRGEERLNHLVRDFTLLAKERGCELVAFSPQSEPERLAIEIDRLTNGRGCDDIVVIIPDPSAVAESVPFLAPDGMLIIFAGVQEGNFANLPLDHTSLYGAQFTGTSGSTVADQLRVLEKVQSKQLSAAQVVAAVGGMEAMQDGLRAVLDKTYAGKVVIYPQLRKLPLHSLFELKKALPEVYKHLGSGFTWTLAAERALFEAWWRQSGEV